MQSNGSVIRDHGFHWPFQQWETVREWARAHITREAILDAVLAAAVLGMAGFELFVLHRALHHYAATGF